MSFSPFRSADLLLLAIVGLIGWHAYYQRQRGRWLLFDPLNFFWAGAVVVYVIQPATYAETLVSWHAQGTLEKTLFWILFGLVFVVVGYEARWGEDFGSLLPRPPAGLVSRRLRIASLVVGALGLLGYALQFSSAGGMSAWLSEGRGATDWTLISGYVALLENFLPLGGFLLLLHANLHRASLVTKAIAWTLPGIILIWFVYLGTRSRTIGFTGLILMGFFLPRRKNPPLALVAVIFCVLFVVVEFQAAYRGNFTNLSFNLDQIDKREAAELVLPNWLGGKAEAKAGTASTGMEFNCVMAVIELVPKEVDYNYGYCFLEFFTRPIPRSMWSGKRYPHYEAFTPIYARGGLSETWNENLNLPILSGPSFTFVGHYFAIGGAFSLALGGLLTGILMRTIRAYLDQNQSNEGTLVLYPFIVGIGFGEATGTPLFWIFSLPFSIICLAILLRLCRARRSKDMHPPEGQQGAKSSVRRKSYRIGRRNRVGRMECRPK